MDNKRDLRKNTGMMKMCIILISMLIVLVIVAVLIPIVVYNVKLVRVSSQATDGQYLSGTVSDVNHAYENIKSIMVKTESEETESLITEDTIPEETVINVYVSFVDGSTGVDAEIEYGEDNAAVLSWLIYTEVDGGMVEEKKSVSFSYINCYPEGFYIIADHDVYSYIETLDNRSGEYTFEEGDISAVNQRYSYVPVDEYYVENECSSDILDITADIEEYIGTFADTESYKSISCRGDYNYEGYYYDGTTWLMMEVDSEYYLLRTVDNEDWEICKCEDFPASFSYLSASFCTQSGVDYLIVRADIYEEGYHACLVSSDYGETFTKILFKITSSDVEFAFYSSYYDSAYQWTAEVEEDVVVIGYNLMILSSEKPNLLIELNLYDILNGYSDSYTVYDLIAMPDNEVTYVE